MNKKALFAAMLAPLLVSVAKATASTPADNSMSISTSRMETSIGRLTVGHPYRTGRRVLAPAIATYPNGATVPGAADLTAGTEFWVLGFDPANNSVTIGIDDAPGSGVISHITLDVDALYSTDFEERARSEFATFEEEEMPDDGSSMDIMGGPRRGKTPSCYADVKNWLLRHRLVKSYPPGAAAWQGYDVLRRSYGFRAAAFTEKLPVGAVCVTQGGRFNCGAQKCGHIAVKIGQNQWYGAGVHPSPLLSNHYNLRCLIK